MKQLAAGVLVGAAITAAIFWLASGPEGERLGDARPGADVPREDAIAAAARDAVSAPALPSPVVERTESTAPAASSGSVDFNAELRRRGLAGIREGWSSQRVDPIPDRLLAKGEAEFEELVATSPAAIGRRLAQNKSKREKVAALGSAFEILEAMKQGDAPAPELARDPAQFDRLFERVSPETSVDGAAHSRDLSDQLVDGATIRFGPGVFRFGLASALQSLRQAPRDLTVSGAGRDLTLLVMNALMAREKLAGFTLRDCTVFNDGPLFDQRADWDATITLDRIRLVGFDCGAGGSSALDLVANALRARDCIFEGGYGSDPTGFCHLLDVRTDAMLARFERCRFVQIEIDLQRRAGWQIVFAACTFEDLRQDGSELPPKHTDGIRFDDCVFTLFDRSRGEPPAKDLNRLFPDWERSAQR